MPPAANPILYRVRYDPAQAPYLDIMSHSPAPARLDTASCDR